MLDLTPLGEKIFLDRYARKDAVRAVQPGERVLYVNEDNNQKEIGYAELTLGDGRVQIAEPGGLRSHTLRREEVDLPVETIVEALERVAGAVAGADADARTRFQALLSGPKFIPAGRVLESVGTGVKTTAMNCFVLGCPPDSRDGIFTTLRQMAELMCKGGGVGINYSSLRPENAYVKGVNGRSSGAVSWMELFSYVTNLIIQGGSRRGAQMAMMADWHPDIIKFINLKRDNKRATGCNMSVAVSDAFMAAVDLGEDWDLVFPDTQHPLYDTVWRGDLKDWKLRQLPVVVWRTLPAREMWNSIVTSAHACAEPGLWFIDRANNDRPGGAEMVGTNPCAEQGLPPDGACNLGHLFLPYFVSRSWWELGAGEAMGTALLDLSGLVMATRTAVQFLDRVVDVSHYPLPGVEARQKQERRLGLGTLGLGEALIRMGYRYGQESVEACDYIYSNIARAAYDESANLAEKFGAAPAWDRDVFSRSGFGARLQARFPALWEKIMALGLRHVCLLTQAPTGTVGTMLNTSTGIEPHYLFEHQRKSRLGTHVERARVVEDYRATHGPTDLADLPDCFVTAMDLAPADHVAVQAAVQKWTDASISKTINCPKDWTVAQIGDVYRSLYEQGCKGGTVYRDGCRDVQVLEALPGDARLIPVSEALKAPTSGARPYPTVRPSVTASRETPGGTIHVHLTREPRTGTPLEVFCDAGRSGSEVRALMEAMGRLMTLVLRVTTETQEERLAIIMGQLRGIGGQNSVGLGPKRVLSMPDGIASALMEAAQFGGRVAEVVGAAGLDVCPHCQAVTLQRASGCETCLSCDFSRC